MKFNCGSKGFWIPMILVAGLAFVGIPLFIRVAPPPLPATKAAPLPVPPAPPPVAPPPEEKPAVRSAPLPEDPVLRQWVVSVKNRRREGVESSQAIFLAREEEYRGPLVKMAKEDEDPRIRAFCVAALGRMKTPPPESFFVGRLDDSSEYPRTSALHALEKIGTAACLPKVEGLASSDAAEGVRAAAAQAAKAVRSR